MWIEQLSLLNVRTFESETISFEKGVNLLIGPNNSGKSTVIGAIAHFQNFGRIGKEATRLGKTAAALSIKLKDADKFFETDEELMMSNLEHHQMTGENSKIKLSDKDADSFMFPFLSHRKVDRYNEPSREGSHRISQDNSDLSSRLSIISNPTHPSNKEYFEACKAILGFEVANIQTKNGLVPGVYIGKNTIPIEAMGDGVGMVAGFLTRLASAEGNLFLIEEPENDLHPSALKKLLTLIVSASDKNQFIISTHSHLVLRHLGGLKKSKIFSLAKTGDSADSITNVKEVESSEDKNQVLLDLGYEINDLDSYDAWLFFEEASMEKIVRDILIPMFVPEIHGRVRTFSTRGYGNMRSRFDELNSLFVYLNLDFKYKSRAWAFVDDGTDEQNMLEGLKKVYVGKHKWDPNCFVQLKKHDLEDYYPSKFNKEKKKVKDAKGSDIEKKLKGELCEKVISWAREDKKAEIILNDSFKEVIDQLKLVEKKLKAKK